MSIKCFVCDGQGRDYCWADRDPIEGWKMANKQKCLFCDGEGVLKDDDRRMPGIIAYTEALDEYETSRMKALQRQAADEAKLIASARAKLTEAELKALGV